MEDTRRKPEEDVFQDIKQAAITTWLQRDYHEDYIREKLDKIHDTKNFADNWCGLIGPMDRINQMIFWHCIKLEDTVTFLKKQSIHYGYFVARDKI